MEIHQFIKVLNNTEIGKGGTNDSYVLVSKKAKKMTEMFDLDNRNPIFINKNVLRSKLTISKVLC